MPLTLAQNLSRIKRIFIRRLHLSITNVSLPLEDSSNRQRERERENFPPSFIIRVFSQSLKEPINQRRSNEKRKEKLKAKLNIYRFTSSYIKFSRIKVFVRKLILENEVGRELKRIRIRSRGGGDTGPPDSCSFCTRPPLHRKPNPRAAYT